MALYRSDQTQLTFGTEAAPGGYADPIIYGGRSIAAQDPLNTVISTGGEVNPGDTSINIDNKQYALVGEFVQIGTVDGSPSANAVAHSRSVEIRRIEAISGGAGTGAGTIYLDAPLGFYHAAGQKVIQIDTYPATSNYARANTFLPGVYDTVNLPEPSNAINPSFFLGTEENRAYTHAYRGTQSLEGSISSFALLNGWPLRFPIGKVVTTAAIAGFDQNLDTNDGPGQFEARKGDYYIKADGNFTLNETLRIGASGAGKEEIRKVLAVASTSGYARLNYPLQFDHSSSTDEVNEVLSASEAATTKKFTHTITETSELDTICWEAAFTDSSSTAAKTLKRRYYGGMVGTATLAAEEGGLLTMSWDSVPFMGMQHNIAEGDLGAGDTGVSLPGYMLMNTELNRVGAPTGTTTAESYPTTEPYYFSQGTITMFGVVIARVRDFSLSINNNVEPRYYIEQRGDNRRRGPSQIHEGRREYSMTCTIVPDAIDATKTSSHVRNVFTEYIGQGDQSAFGTNAAMTGFAMELAFIRGPLGEATDGNDTITITIPASSGGKPGALLTAAPLQIDGNNPLQVSAEILIRTLSIVVEDNEPFYP